MAGTPPKKNTAYTFPGMLISRADNGIFQASPTLAAGDFRVSVDGGAFNNLATLPTVSPAVDKQIIIQLSAAEMNGDSIVVAASDQAGLEWCDAYWPIMTDAVQLSDIACDVWDCATRTLTQSATSIVGAVTGSDINILRGDTLSASITGLGNIANRTKLWFTVKNIKDDPDTSSIIQITEVGGLIYLNGADATVPAYGSITIDDAVAGDITIELDEVATATLAIRTVHYDIQVLRITGAVNTLTEGAVNISADVTRAII